ncbi:J domain-containing protein, partial [Ideonella sp. 4Y11]
MSRERRNLYRILHVQPEAPPEVIKAAWRALMSTLRAHPDLGGDPETAARLNAAYEVLSDPVRRAAYDRGLKRTPRGPAAPSADSAPRATASPPPAPPPRAA